MTTHTPDAIAITPETPPVFPCELGRLVEPACITPWQFFEKQPNDHLFARATHWRPLQPAPLATTGTPRTPRTDEVARMPTDVFPTWVTPVAFARQLETELAEVTNEAEKLRTERDALRVAAEQAKGALESAWTEVAHILNDGLVTIDNTSAGQRQAIAEAIGWCHGASEKLEAALSPAPLDGKEGSK